MVRIFNFFCLAAMGLTILALYHISESTRVARVELNQVGRQIADTRGEISVLQTEWERVAGPGRIQVLAEQQLGMSDSSSVRLSSFDQMPHREAPLDNSPLRNANAVVPDSASPANPTPGM